MATQAGSIEFIGKVQLDASELMKVLGMGGGKGAVDHFIAEVKPGTVLFEISGISKTDAMEAMRLAANKLPVRTKFLSKI